MRESETSEVRKDRIIQIVCVFFFSLLLFYVDVVSFLPPLRRQQGFCTNEPRALSQSVNHGYHFRFDTWVRRGE